MPLYTLSHFCARKLGSPFSSADIFPVPASTCTGKDSGVHETKSSQVDLEYSLVDARGPGFSPRPWPGGSTKIALSRSGRSVIIYADGTLNFFVISVSGKVRYLGYRVLS